MTQREAELIQEAIWWRFGGHGWGAAPVGLPDGTIDWSRLVVFNGRGFKSEPCETIGQVQAVFRRLAEQSRG